MARKDGRRTRPLRVPWRRIVKWTFLATLLVFAGLLFGLVYAQVKTPLNLAFEDKDDETFFKYGSLGNNVTEGFPLKLWTVLPDVCTSLIGKKGYADLGFLYEPGRDTPIGFSKYNAFGIDLVAINCAVCHTQTYRPSAESTPKIVVGGTAQQLNSQGYLRFISSCAASPQFSAEPILKAVQKRFPQTWWWERQLYRFAIPTLRDIIQTRLTERYAWTWRRPEWGPGRVDPFNPVKFDYLKQPIDETIGNSDIMTAWNAGKKEKIREALRPADKTYWHWDGLSSDLFEVVVNSALGDGTSRWLYDEPTMRRLTNYLRKLVSPKIDQAVSADHFQVNEELRTAGKQLFRFYCASCHGEKGERVLTLIPEEEIGTDPNRLRMWTSEATDAYNAYDKVQGLPWNFDNFNNIEGYIAQPLDGIWLAGPYLHNGSIPTLMTLLKPAAARQRTFVRGLDIIDFKNGGYVSPPCDPVSYKGPGFCYDTGLQGNSNLGHDYGAVLSDDERRALVHYLMTL